MFIQLIVFPNTINTTLGQTTTNVFKSRLESTQLAQMNSRSSMLRSTVIYTTTTKWSNPIAASLLYLDIPLSNTCKSITTYYRLLSVETFNSSSEIAENTDENCNNKTSIVVMAVTVHDEYNRHFKWNTCVTIIYGIA